MNRDEQEQMLKEYEALLAKAQKEVEQAQGVIQNRAAPIEQLKGAIFTIKRVLGMVDKNGNEVPQTEYENMDTFPELEPTKD